MMNTHVVDALAPGFFAVLTTVLVLLGWTLAKRVVRDRRRRVRAALGPLFQLNHNPYLEAWATRPPPPELQEAIRRLARTVLSPTSRPAGLQPDDDRLYLGRNKVEQYFLHPCGDLSIEDGASRRTALPGQRLLLVRRAVEAYPVLAPLLPTVPPGAARCPACAGQGRRPSRGTVTWCTACDALGWIPARAAPPSPDAE